MTIKAVFKVSTDSGQIRYLGRPLPKPTSIATRIRLSIQPPTFLVPTLNNLATSVTEYHVRMLGSASVPCLVLYSFVSSMRLVGARELTPASRRLYPRGRGVVSSDAAYIANESGQMRYLARLAPTLMVVSCPLLIQPPTLCALTCSILHTSATDSQGSIGLSSIFIAHSIVDGTARSLSSARHDWWGSLTGGA